MPRYLGGDDLIGLAVYAKRFFSQQMLAGAQDIHVEPLVEVVRHGAVDRLDVALGQQVVIVSVGPHSRQRLAEPGHRVGVGVADGDDLWPHADVTEMDPARGGAGELTAHQPAADDAKLDDALRRHACASVNSFAACSGVAPSWTIAISARVTPCGESC